MARVAVISQETNVVLAIIVAEATDTPHQGTFLVDVDHTACNLGWIYDPILNDFIDPNPPPPDGGVD